MLGKIASAALGPIIGGAFSAYGAHQQNNAGQAASREMMDFQERMSSTAYQRAMADMRSAGLNPILAYQQGGASTPAGASYTPQNEFAGLGNAFGQATSSALDAWRTSADTALKGAQADTEAAKRVLYIGQDALNMSQSQLNHVQEAVARANETQLKAMTEQVRAQTGLTEAQLDTEKLKQAIQGLDLEKAKANLPEMQRRGEVFTGEMGTHLAYAWELARIIDKVPGLRSLLDIKNMLGSEIRRETHDSEGRSTYSKTTTRRTRR